MWNISMQSEIKFKQPSIYIYADIYADMDAEKQLKNPVLSLQ